MESMRASLDRQARGTRMADESEFQVAILLPVQGTDEALDRTVASVLAQTERRWTLWLIESEDARGRAARWLGTDPRVRRLPHAGGGRAAALGAALARCPGDYLVFLDAEHSWEPGFLALTTAFLRANPLEDLVCMEAVTPSGRPAVVRRAIFRERGALCAALDLPAGTTPDGALDGAVWYRGELAQHLRWGEYSRMAVTLMTSDAALRLAPALGRESAALEYRLQARLARTSAVNLLALRGGGPAAGGLVGRAGAAAGAGRAGGVRRDPRPPAGSRSGSRPPAPRTSRAAPAIAGPAAARAWPRSGPPRRARGGVLRRPVWCPPFAWRHTPGPGRAAGASPALIPIAAPHVDCTTHSGARKQGGELGAILFACRMRDGFCFDFPVPGNN